MKLKIKIIWTSVVILVFCSVFMIQKIVNQDRQKRQPSENLLSNISKLHLENIGGSSFLLPVEDISNTIVIYYSSECDHCQYEATEIKKSIASFSNANILMISSEPIKTIKSFSEQYGLSDEASVIFAKINRDDVYETFGSVSIPPHLYLWQRPQAAFDTRHHGG